MRWKSWKPGFIAVLALLVASHVLSGVALAQDGTDWVTKFPREPAQVSTWPGGKKVAVSFALFVEVFGFGQGPVFRPDLATRNPDLVNEAFRQYAVTWGNLRVARLFKELDVPLSVVLNATFPRTYPSVWKEFRAAHPKAPIIAHGMNNSNDILPLGRGLAEQKDYVRRTLDLIASTTGVRPIGWSSPSVYSNADTMQAMAAEGITYNLDQMDSDTISRLKTPAGAAAISNSHSRYGSVSGEDEVAQRNRDPLAGLCVGAGQRGPRQSGARGHNSGHRTTSLRGWHARWRGRHAACSLAPQER